MAARDRRREPESLCHYSHGPVCWSDWFAFYIANQIRKKHRKLIFFIAIAERANKEDRNFPIRIFTSAGREIASFQVPLFNESDVTITSSKYFLVGGRAPGAHAVDGVRAPALRRRQCARAPVHPFRTAPAARRPGRRLQHGQGAIVLLLRFCKKISRSLLPLNKLLMIVRRRRSRAWRRRAFSTATRATRASPY